VAPAVKIQERKTLLPSDVAFRAVGGLSEVGRAGYESRSILE
jgi:hypothetical protein